MHILSYLTFESMFMQALMMASMRKRFRHDPRLGSSRVHDHCNIQRSIELGEGGTVPLGAETIPNSRTALVRIFVACFDVPVSRFVS